MLLSIFLSWGVLAARADAAAAPPPHPTSTSVSCAPVIVVVGRATSCTATVTDTAPAPIVPSAPTGSVAFSTNSVGAFSANSCALPASGSCQVTYTPGAVGSHTITASYGGDAAHAASAGNTTVTVVAPAKHPTSTTVNCVPGSVVVGQATACSATVTDTAGSGQTTPTGSVAFSSNSGGTFSAGSCALAGGGASASCQVNYTPNAVGSGSHTIAASYGGDTTHTASNNNTTVTVTVAPPANITPPTIAGADQLGQTLTVAQGSWTNTPSISDQWQRCNGAGNGCVSTGSTGPSYALTPADVAHKIRVLETASNGGGSNTEPSAATPPVLPLPPGNTLPPTIAGPDQPGQTLTETHGSWTNSPTMYSYQWQRCNSSGSGCAVIAGETNQTYILTIVDLGLTIKVSETATNDGGPGGPVSSVQTPVVVLVLPALPSNTAPPTISGTAQQAQTLTATQGSWTNNPASITDQWQRCSSSSGCLAIAGATSQTYTLRGEDVGQTIRVMETALNARGPGQASSAPTAVVLPPPAPTLSPVLAPVAGATAPNVPRPNLLRGTITATMQWSFFYTRTYTRVLTFVVNGAPVGATVLVGCRGRGCPFANRTNAVAKPKRCRRGGRHRCKAQVSGRVDLMPRFGKHRLHVGAQIIVEFRAPGLIGKRYVFTVRAGRAPRVQIGCLAPGGGRPGVGC